MTPRLLTLGLAGLCLHAAATAQDIEPRRWTAFPVGTHVVGLGYAYGQGDIELDPALSIEDAGVETQTALTTYVHSFEALGKLARFDVRVPYQHSRWEGLLSGSRRSRSVQGFADPTVRLSMNLTGPPAAEPARFREYLQAHPTYTTLGVALAVQLPLGEYEDDKVLNLGQNRFVIRPQIGALHVRGPWSYELTASTFFYTDNDDFVTDQELEQDPLFAMQGHVVRSFRSGLWAAAGAAYGWSGETTIDGVAQDDERGNLLFGCSLGFALTGNQGVRVGYVGGRTAEDVGVDSDSLFLSWTVRL